MSYVGVICRCYLSTSSDGVIYRRHLLASFVGVIVYSSQNSFAAPKTEMEAAAAATEATQTPLRLLLQLLRHLLLLLQLLQRR